MKKKIIAFFTLSFFVMLNSTKVFASNIKEISDKEFYKLQHWNIIDVQPTQVKYQIYYISLSLLFIAILITTIFYFRKNAKSLMLSSSVIAFVILFLGVYSVYDYTTITSRTQHVASDIVKEINKKTYLENRSLLKRYEDNDYGFHLSNIRTNSKILEANHQYSLSMQVSYTFPFNFFGSFNRFYDYNFTYKPENNKDLKIVYLDDKIKTLKRINTTNYEISNYNTLCFSEEDLDKYNVGKNLEIIGEHNGLYSQYELDYVDLYSSKEQSKYCGNIRYDEKPYIGVDDNKTIYLREVK